MIIEAVSWGRPEVVAEHFGIITMTITVNIIVIIIMSMRMIRLRMRTGMRTMKMSMRKETPLMRTGMRTMTMSMRKETPVMWCVMTFGFVVNNHVSNQHKEASRLIFICKE